MASTVPPHPIDVDAHLVAQAEAREIDVRYICERALKRALTNACVTADEYYASNKDAIDRYNIWIEDNGMPFEDMRAYK